MKNDAKIKDFARTTIILFKCSPHYMDIVQKLYKLYDYFYLRN